MGHLGFEGMCWSLIVGICVMGHLGFEGMCWSLIVDICVMGHLVFEGHTLVIDCRYLCDGSLGV